MDPLTQHGGTPAEQRCRYIFRYYVFNEKNSEDVKANQLNSTLKMTYEQFKTLIEDINRMKNNSPLDDDILNNEVINGFKIFGLNSKSETLLLSEFLIGIGQLKFRGTSVLFRLSKSLKELFNDVKYLSQLYPNNSSKLTKKAIEKQKSPLHEAQQSFNIEMDETETGYELATHTVKVKRTGALFDIAKLWDLEGATTPNISIDQTFKNFDFKILPEKGNNFNRLESVDFFNQQSQPNEMLRFLKKFCFYIHSLLNLDLLKIS